LVPGCQVLSLAIWDESLLVAYLAADSNAAFYLIPSQKTEEGEEKALA
jgi:hypothetical protein